ncbi:MAG: hypothetical protein GY859_23840, partial [Desulfobacterales bacterium]|nr:hypothetical protein [Desulfobacterales bacterium]
VVTTRTKVRDLDNFVDASVERVSLENLAPASGAMLLKNQGVKGADEEIRKAAKEFDCHALALNLLGRFLAVAHDGDIRKRDRIPNLEKEQRKGGHARRVMESYERWLAGKPELSILYMMGLFDRPVKQGAIKALMEAPQKKGITSALKNIVKGRWKNALQASEGFLAPLKNLSSSQWKFALENLRSLRLISERDESHSENSEAPLDCHPLVREHFGQKLRDRHPKAWKEAHGRLYEYYKGLPEKELPDTLEEMEPLFAAVAHGCQAGRHQEALYDV